MPTTPASPLRSPDAGADDPSAAAGTHRRKGAGPQPFDFRTPNKLSREHVRALQMVHEVFARQVATVFASMLRTAAQVVVTGIDQQTWSEFAGATPDPSYLSVIALDPLPGSGILSLPLDLVMVAVDLLLGGSGHGKLPTRPPTEIESVLLHDLVERILRELTQAHEPLFTFGAEIARQESSLQFVQLAAPADPVVVVSYEVKLAEIETKAALCVPLTTLQPVLDAATKLAQADARGRAGNADALRDAIGFRLMDAAVNVSVCFHEARLTPTEILGLTVGDILPLNHPESEPLTLFVAGRPFLAVRPGRRGKRLACMVVPSESEEH